MPHSIKIIMLSDGPVMLFDKHIDRPKGFSCYCRKKIQIDLVCLYPSIRSLKFQRFGVTQEFSTAVQCLQINNEEQTRVSQELYPLCFSSHCPLLLTKIKKKPQKAMMVQRPQRHQHLDATAVTPGRTAPPGLLMCYQYLVHRDLLCLPGGLLVFSRSKHSSSSCW